MRLLVVQYMAGVAGSETYYLKFLPALVAAGVDVSFLAVEKPHGVDRNDEFTAALQEAGVEVDRLVVKHRIRWHVVRKIARYIRERRFDVVQSNLIHADIWLSMVKRFYLKDLVLLSVKHGYSEAYQTKHGFDITFLKPSSFTIATRIACSNADLVVTISKALRDFFVRSGLILEHKIEVVPYGFDYDAGVHKREPGELRYGKQQIVCVGRLVPVKQHHLLLQAFVGLHRDFPGLKLVIVGSGTEEASLRFKAQAQGTNDAVVWTGYRTNVHDYIRDSDILVFPSRAEGFGAVIIEAWHHGKAVVAFDAPAQNEIITHGHDGLLVPANDSNALEEAIRTLLGDPGRMKALGDAGRRTAYEQYSMSKLVTRMTAIFKRLAASK